MRVITGHDQEVAEWAGRMGGVAFVPPYSALGVIDDAGELVGAAVFNDYYPGGNVDLGYYGPRTMSRHVFRSLADFAFNQLNASRVSMKVRKTNVPVRRMMGRHGFEFEGVRKQYLDKTPDGDILCFVLFKHSVKRWLN